MLQAELSDLEVISPGDGKEPVLIIARPCKEVEDSVDASYPCQTQLENPFEYQSELSEYDYMEVAI